MLSPKVFWSRTKTGQNGCIEWSGCLDRSGYGRVGVKQIPAHRVAYRLAKGEPGDMLVCHSCDNPKCVNPDHLWLGTHKDNMSDMTKKGRHAKQKQNYCIHGHLFDAQNTYIKNNGTRACRACNLASVNKYKLGKAGMLS